MKNYYSSEFFVSMFKYLSLNSVSNLKINIKLEQYFLNLKQDRYELLQRTMQDNDLFSFHVRMFMH